MGHMRAEPLAMGRWLEVERTSKLDRDQQIAAIYDQHYGHLCELAYMIMGDRYLAEEIVMEALMKTYTGWGRIREKDKAPVYLKRAVINLCRTKIRRKMIERRANAVAIATEERREPDWDPERHETAREVWAAVKELPLRQRSCIVLFYAQRMTDSEIAEVLDCSVGTVRSQLSRARAKLKRALDPEGLRGGTSG